MNTFTLCLLVSLTTLACAFVLQDPTAMKQTIRFKPTDVRVPRKVSNAMAKSLSPDHPINLIRSLKSRHNSRPGETSAVPLLDYYQRYLIGNITIGSPAQTFSVAFDIWRSDLSVIDVNATSKSDDTCDDTCDCGCDDDDGDDYTCDCYCDYCDDTAESAGPDLSDKQLYNSSASSTSAKSNGNFTSIWKDTGVVVSDKVNIGGLSASVNFGDITNVTSYIAGYPMDGFLGLSPKPSKNSGLTNLLKQLSGSLALPVLTMHLNRSVDDWYSWKDVAPNTDAEIVLGTNVLSQCNANNWKSIKLNPQSVNSSAPFIFNATSISSSASGCHSTVKANHPIWVVDYYYPMAVSYQVEELIVEASGAVFNSSNGWYMVPDMSNTSSVNISLADGNVLTLNIQDIILPFNGKNYLNVYGYYNEDDTRYAERPILLGQQWLNSRCISYNINVNTLSITDALPNNGQ